MLPFMGFERVAFVDSLLAHYDAVAAGEGSRWVSIEAPLGWGKTRLVQELYGRLAADRQPGGAY